MFNEVPSDALGLEWEPAHQLIQLIDPIAQLRKWVKKVYHVHGKDATVDRRMVEDYGVLCDTDWYAPERTPDSATATGATSSTSCTPAATPATSASKAITTPDLQEGLGDDRAEARAELPEVVPRRRLYPEPLGELTSARRAELRRAAQWRKKMKYMHSEWKGRLNHWLETLKQDFYLPLGRDPRGGLPDDGAPHARGGRQGPVRADGRGRGVGPHLRILLDAREGHAAARGRGQADRDEPAHLRRDDRVCRWQGVSAPTAPTGSTCRITSSWTTA